MSIDSCRQTLFVSWLNRSAPGLRLDRYERLLCAGPPPLIAGSSIFDAASASLADCPRVAAAALIDRGTGGRRPNSAGTLTTVVMATALTGLTVVLISIVVACRYRRLFPRLKSLHCMQHWQVRYREVSGDLETTLSAHNPLFLAAADAGEHVA